MSIEEAIPEVRERALIELTAKAAEVALQPLNNGTADTLCDLAREVLRVAGQPVH